MAHVVSFSIEGLAGRSETFSATLNRDVNIFFGLNGSGKTSLLRILNSAFENNASLLQRTPFQRAEVKIYSIAFDAIVTRTFEQPKQAPSPPKSDVGLLSSTNYFIGTAFAGQAVPTAKKDNWKTSIEPASKSSVQKAVEKGLAHAYLPTSRLYEGMSTVQRFSSGIAANTQINEEVLDNLFADILSRRWKDYSSFILRKVQEAQASGLARILKAFLSSDYSKSKRSKASDRELEDSYKLVKSFLARQGSVDVLGTLNAFQERYQGDPRVRQVVDDIDVVERTISDVQMPRAKLSNLISTSFSGSKSIVFNDDSVSVKSGDGTDIGLANLSSGEKQLLLILLTTILAQENSLIIDEPEISMHVDWQTEYVNISRSLNPACQLIVATHSPEIASVSADKYLFRL